MHAQTLDVFWTHTRLFLFVIHELPVLFHNHNTAV